MTKLFGSALTPEQLAERRKGIGASDAAKILAGGQEWITLWRNKTNRDPDKAVMSEWNAALRHTTESLQLEWYEHKTGLTVHSRGLAVISQEHPILRCTLDGATDDAIIEVKHVSQFTPGDAVQWAIEKYYAQLQHQLIVTGAPCVILSVMDGMKEPQLRTFTLDPFYADDYIKRAEEFWWYVSSDVPPPGAEEMDAPPIPHDEMREVDMTGSNEWSNFAADWLENKKAAGVFKKAEAGLKELVEKDVKKATGHGIVISRSKANALSVKAEK